LLFAPIERQNIDAGIGRMGRAGKGGWGEPRRCAKGREEEEKKKRQCVGGGKTYRGLGGWGIEGVV